MSRRARVAVIGAGIGAAHVEAYCANAALYQVAVFAIWMQDVPAKSL
jgi:hypothetical protein